MIDYKNNKLLFKPEAYGYPYTTEYVSAYNLCLLYRSVTKYKLENPKAKVKDITKALSEIAEILRYAPSLILQIDRHTNVVEARNAFDQEEYVKRSYRIGRCYFLYNYNYAKTKGLFVDTKEYYRIALEMYMDMEVSLNGFYFYLDPLDITFHKKCKKYSQLWDIPIRNSNDIQPLYNMDSIIKQHVSEQKDKTKLPF
jgi:hypothetical protein